MDQNPTKPLLTRKAAALYISNVLGFPISYMTLATLASKGHGPVYVKIGLRTFYETADLIAWIASRRSAKLTSTSHEAELRRLAANAKRKPDVDP